ncbi:MAG: membrane dipeptidase [Bacteroidota bacterium]
MPIPLFDAHLDLAWNAVSFNRDLTLDVETLRRQEQHMDDEPSRGKCTTSLPELKRAGVFCCVATLLVRGGPNQVWPTSFKRTDLNHATPSIAHAAAHGQLAYYRLLEAQGHLRFVTTQEMLLQEAPADWMARTPGIVLSMEGADPITHPDELQLWWDAGLRALGPVHYGQGQYAFGTGVVGPFNKRGLALLREMDRLGMILDVTHLCDESMAQAFDHFDGAILASHHNCRTLVPGDRQLTDAQIKTLVSRGAVIGAALDAWMLYPGWERGVTQPDVVGLAAVADHIDHVCQLAGSAAQAAIGSDLDGGFGFEQTPHDLKTIADLQKLAPILSARGYSDEEIAGIFYGNWMRFFAQGLPAG